MRRPQATGLSGKEAKMQRRLVAIVVSIAVVGSVVAALVVAVNPWSSSAPYVEYGEPKDRPYVVVRVYGGSVFHINETVVAEIVLLNPWDEEATVFLYGFQASPYFDILSSNGSRMYRSSYRMINSFGSIISMSPGEERVLLKVLWRPTTLDVYHSYRDRVEMDVFGSSFCNFRVPGEEYAMQGFVGRMKVVLEPVANPGFSYYYLEGMVIDAQRVNATVTFTGIPGPCLAENAPYLDLRLNGYTFNLNETVVVDYFLINPRNAKVVVSFDYSSSLDLWILAGDGRIIFPPPPLSHMRPISGWNDPTKGPGMTLEPGEERLLMRIWWNESSLSIWKLNIPWFWDYGRSYDLPFIVQNRVTGEYTIVAALNWMSLWEGAAHDWEVTPVPQRVEPQEVAATLVLI
jgi:hypothetical protein